LLANLPNPYPKVPTRPCTLEVLRAKERAPIFSPSVVFTFGLEVKSIKESGGVSLQVRATNVFFTIIFKQVYYFI
jgi:hypothetical protein